MVEWGPRRGEAKWRHHGWKVTAGAEGRSSKVVVQGAQVGDNTMN